MRICENIVASYDYQGTPPYHLRIMLKVCVYAYLVGIRSSRKIDALLHDSLVFMYLAGRQTPNFRTICRFRREHGNRIEEVFDHVVEICVKMDMVGVGQRWLRPITGPARTLKDSWPNDFYPGYHPALCRPAASVFDSARCPAGPAQIALPVCRWKNGRPRI